MRLLSCKVSFMLVFNKEDAVINCRIVLSDFLVHLLQQSINLCLSHWLFFHFFLYRLLRSFNLLRSDNRLLRNLLFRSLEFGLVIKLLLLNGWNFNFFFLFRNFLRALN